MKLKKSLLLTTFITTLFVQGCVSSRYIEREEWSKPKFQMGLKIRSLKDGEPKINRKQLAEEVGYPDIVISPEEFKSRLSVDDKLHKKFIKRLVQIYLKAKDIEFDHFAEDDFYANYEFDKNCVLWLYDESLHYNKPAHPPKFSMGAYIGFTCYCFYVEGNDVIGESCFDFWEPLKAKAL